MVLHKKNKGGKLLLFVYLDSFEPFPTPVPFQSLESIPTYKNDISDSGIT